MTNFYKGVAGARNKNPVGIVIHNDAGSQNATVAFYKAWLPTHNAENGFAHVYVASDGTYYAEDYKNKAWHTANADGNANYIGLEVCQSMGNKDTFLSNEQKTFKVSADILMQFGLPANRNTVRLHREFSATSCPHRSWELHGAFVTAVKDYYISQINQYMTKDKKEETQEEKGGVATMYLIYWIPSASGKGEDAYFFNGVTYKYIAHPDTLVVLKDVYRRNNGKEIPEIHWVKGAPWWTRLEAVATKA